ncbi:hypothetical protein HN446_03360 [bacterium]|jgi:hypothetical protein|nr:hypothetical protein [bacterium]
MKAVKLMVVIGFFLVGSMSYPMSHLWRDKQNQFISVSFDNPFPKTPLTKVYQLSKQVWADVILFKEYNNLCERNKDLVCAGQQKYLGNVVDRVLKFHHAVSGIEQHLPPVIDDVEYICAIIDHIKSDFRKACWNELPPEYFCINVVLDNVKNSLEVLMS